MSGREQILAAIRAQRIRSAPRPAPYRRAPAEDDLVSQFSALATRAAAEVRRLGSLREVPAAVADVLRARNLPAVVHMPKGSPAERALPWDLAPGLDRLTSAPGPDDAAVSLAPLAIAETGTLVYSAAADAPASWHFRPGLEIAVVPASAIVADFETVLARVKADGAWPSTLNLVTGPSRTGDIEQTLELGAHGPKALVVLVVDDVVPGSPLSRG